MHGHVADSEALGHFARGCLAAVGPGQREPRGDDAHDVWLLVPGGLPQRAPDLLFRGRPIEQHAKPLVLVDRTVSALVESHPDVAPASAQRVDREMVGDDAKPRAGRPGRVEAIGANAINQPHHGIRAHLFQIAGVQAATGQPELQDIDHSVRLEARGIASGVEGSHERLHWIL